MATVAELNEAIEADCKLLASYLHIDRDRIEQTIDDLLKLTENLSDA